jgi:hypothetical protein
LDATGGLLEIECFAGGLDFQNATNVIAIQSKKLARRFGLSNTMATTVAEIAFHVGGAR